MIMHEVESSNVKAIGYHQGEKTLKIVFKNKKEYLYHDVEIEIFDELLKTESIGKFLSQNVYKNYSYSMVVTEENKKKQEKTKKEKTEEK